MDQDYSANRSSQGSSFTSQLNNILLDRRHPHNFTPKALFMLTEICFCHLRSDKTKCSPVHKDKTKQHNIFNLQMHKTWWKKDTIKSVSLQIHAALELPTANDLTTFCFVYALLKIGLIQKSLAARTIMNYHNTIKSRNWKCLEKMKNKLYALNIHR